MKRSNFHLTLLAIAIFLSLSFISNHSSAQVNQNSRAQAIQKLKDNLSNRGRTNLNRATGLVDFARLTWDSPGSLTASFSTASAREKSAGFFREHGAAFGLDQKGSELTIVKENRDAQGGTHITYQQTYKGVAVFGAILKTHFNAEGDLRAVNGVAVPDISLDPVPAIPSQKAGSTAVAKVQSGLKRASDVTAKNPELYIYRTMLARGVKGENHLVWKVEVTNGSDVREFVFVDAYSGEFVDQITGVYEALGRRVYDGQNLPVLFPPSYPDNPFWFEGQPFPTGVAEADSIILTSKETYDLYKNAFGRDSFDGTGSPMVSIFNSGPWAGNAASYGYFTVYGSGLGVDDVVAHEWTHSYTAFTHGLIYQWQPGALNEAYSDIFGETVDLLNNDGLDSPGGPRQPGNCQVFRNPTPTLHINSPTQIAGDYSAAPGLFGPPISPSGFSGKVVLVDDGVGVGTPPEPSRTDGCQSPFRNASKIQGNIALIDRTRYGTCIYSEKVKNAQLNGAIAVIIANDIVEGETPRPIFGEDPSVTIPSALVGYTVGQILRKQPGRSVNVTLTGSTAPTDYSYRWFLGEEPALTSGGRDMWEPTCMGNPGKTSDREYFCGLDDNGGVHTNSGIPNHAYALLVDGGTYNHQTIQPLGFTKALHIYFRAMSIYQTPTTDFADHAEALEASAADLIGVNLPDLATGLPSGQIISAADVDQVHKATLAVELRTPPSQCGFPPLLAKNPPADACPAPQNTQVTLFSDGFENDPASRWVISSEPGSPATFLPREWTWVHQLPDGRPGSGFFAIDPLDDCTSALPGQAGVLHLESPAISLPRVMLGGPHLSFDHWVATEARYDGGQLMISVNDGPFILVAPSAFLYNAYNTTLFPAPAGYEFLSPRAGQPAFSGVDGGSVDGSWGTSIVDLTPYARSGDRIKLHWDLSTDYCYGTNLGWYLDNVRVYACRP